MDNGQHLLLRYFPKTLTLLRRPWASLTVHPFGLIREGIKSLDRRSTTAWHSARGMILVVLKVSAKRSTGDAAEKPIDGCIATSKL